ncbi:TPA: PD-(D/E)XK nuclease-like domain-containing protein [Clostridium botulinum]|nr:PD-(D/E)XK nuclease-like domain-containing protein [Clostridium botulinum]HDK7201485.1 PD-(D/E)XK nuclease-like domain-containing protein [Clostridium botulinum]
MSVSLFKSFLEEYNGCEARTMATLNGEWEENKTDAFLVGSYVHSWNEGKLEEFKKEHSEMYSTRGSTKGQLKKEFQVANKMIETLSRDRLVQKVREGQKEVLMSAEIFDIPWKCMIDIYNPKMKSFTDLKTTRSIHQKYWNEYEGIKQNFIEYYGYDIQMAIYAEIERLYTGASEYLFPHIIAVSKENIPDKAVIKMGTDFIEDTLLNVSMKIERVKKVWKGEIEPINCGKCDYCKTNKQLKEIIHYKEL